MVEVNVDGSEAPESARESSITDDDSIAIGCCFHLVGGKPEPVAGALDVGCSQRGLGPALPALPLPRFLLPGFLPPVLLP